jgi:hypothetical protein
LAYQPPASSTFLSQQTSQQYFSLRTNQHQPSATSQTNRLSMCCSEQQKIRVKDRTETIIVTLTGPGGIGEEPFIGVRQEAEYGVCLDAKYLPQGKCFVPSICL